MDKSVNAASRQVEDIKLISSCVGLSSLPEKLQDAAVLRLEHPDLPLKELAELTEPPVSKSGMNHRLARISELAQRLREEAEDEKV
jgi:DNA-binding protein WhiA